MAAAPPPMLPGRIGWQAVAEANRRQGVASALLRGAESLATRWGFPQSALALHVYAQTTGARALYHRAGWVELYADATLPSLLLGRQQRVLLVRRRRLREYGVGK